MKSSKAKHKQVPEWQGVAEAIQNATKEPARKAGHVVKPRPNALSQQVAIPTLINLARHEQFDIVFTNKAGRTLFKVSFSRAMKEVPHLSIEEIDRRGNILRAIHFFDVQV